jgi:uncharacterized membrane protein YozB (DUF420 family)
MSVSTLAKRPFPLLILTAIALFVTSVAVKALLEPFAVEDFPDTLYVKVERIPAIFTVHMVTGGLALLLVPLAIALSRRPRWHRPVARIAALDIAIAGITAFPVALVVPVTRVSAAGFCAQGAAWLVLLVAGIVFIRRKNVARHRECMLLLAAVTSGAVFFRIYLALWAIFGSLRWFEVFYALDAWIAWLIPLAIMAFLIKRAGGFNPNRR